METHEENYFESSIKEMKDSIRSCYVDTVPLQKWCFSKNDHVGCKLHY